MIALAETRPQDRVIRIGMTGRRQSRDMLRDQVMLIRAAIASWRRSLSESRDGLIELALAGYRSGGLQSGAGVDPAHVHRILEILAASTIAGRLQARSAAEDAGAELPAQESFAETFPRDLPPAKAIQWIKQLPAVTRDVWESAMLAKRQAAFFITGIEQQEILRVIQSEIQESLRQGLSLAKFEDRVRARVADLALTGGRLRNVWHNNVSNSYRASRYEELGRPEIKAVLGYYLFDAIVDGVVRSNHAALEGGIAPVDWSGWEKYGDPLGFNCRCSRIAISEIRAEQMITSGQGWDMLQGVPAEAGPDPGYVRMGG